MVIWGLIWGALLGSVLPGWWVNAISGGILGALIGLSLRLAVRKEIDARVEHALAERAHEDRVLRAARDARVLRAAREAATAAGGAQVSAAATPAGPPPSAATAAAPPAAPTATPPLGTAAAGGPPPAPTGAAANASLTDWIEEDEVWAVSDTPLPNAAPLPRSSQASTRSGAAGSTRPSTRSSTRTTHAAPPSRPGGVDTLIGGVLGWFTGGNPIVRIGLVILFIGLAFLARFAAQAGLLPPALRLAMVGAAGVALLVLGFRKRLARPDFGLALQGGGVAVLYLTVLAAFRLYALLPQGAAFVLLVLICALGCALALLQNARGMAFGAFAGGFAAPYLLSTGEGQHVVLFTYFALLDLGVLAIASRRAWRELNLLGFVATFGSATLWGWMRYAPANYASAQGFLWLFIAIFTAAAIFYARRQPMRLGNMVDSTLVFGTALAGFGLQMGLVQHLEHGTAFAALGFGAAYLLLALALRRRGGPGDTLLVEAFLALGVGFVTLAVPLALNAQWTSGVWALEGAAAFWVGARQARWMPRAFGLLLLGLGIVAFGGALHPPVVGAWPLAHSGFLGAVLIALPLAGVAWLARQPLGHSDSGAAQVYASLERGLSAPLFLVGFAFWCLAWALEAGRTLPVGDGMVGPAVLAPHVRVLALMLAVLLSAAAALRWAEGSGWAVAAWPSRLSLPVLVMGWLAYAETGHHVPQSPGWLAWPLALGLHLFLLRRNECPPAKAQQVLERGWRGWLRAQHPGGVWLALLLLADALWWAIGRANLWGTAWASVVGLVSATAVLAALTLWASKPRARRVWPLRPHAEGYYWIAALPLAALLLLGTLALAWTSSGRADPLPYLPLLNPTDLSIALALAALLLWRHRVLAARPQPAGAAVLAKPGFWLALGGVALVAISTVWLRVVHHYFGVPWQADALFRSFLVQTGYSILWTLLALALMVGAHRRGTRGAWLAGAGLLGLVIVKLLLIDLGNSGGAERIVAFIGVGVLMLVVGYFAPLPPRAAPVSPSRKEPRR